MPKGETSYKDAGVDIDAGNEAVSRIKHKVKMTFTSNVLTGIGGFGSLYNLKPILKFYKNPVLVQSIDGVGTKTIIARMVGEYKSIGIDLLSACSNDIIVMGARPLTFLDYIANDKLQPDIIEDIVSGMIKACKETGVSLVGGETAEMPDTYLPGEHDLVGVITGIVEKEKIINGNSIKSGDVVMGLPSNGLHTNGYSLARKIFFNIGKFNPKENISTLDKSIGHELLKPHINYSNHVFAVLDKNIKLKGIAHITGGGMIENISRILPSKVNVEIKKGTWPELPIFNIMQSIGKVDEKEMFRTFNMGVGMVYIVDPDNINKIKNVLKEITPIYEIGSVVSGSGEVFLK